MLERVFLGGGEVDGDSGIGGVTVTVEWRN